MIAYSPDDRVRILEPSTVAGHTGTVIGPTTVETSDGRNRDGYIVRLPHGDRVHIRTDLLTPDTDGAS